MDDGDNPIILEPNNAEFLGKTCAFRLPQEMQINGNVVNFRADYPVGYPKKLSTIRIDRNLVVLESPHSKTLASQGLTLQG